MSSNLHAGSLCPDGRVLVCERLDVIPTPRKIEKGGPRHFHPALEYSFGLNVRIEVVGQETCAPAKIRRTAPLLTKGVL